MNSKQSKITISKRIFQKPDGNRVSAPSLNITDQMTKKRINSMTATTLYFFLIGKFFMLISNQNTSTGINL